MESSGSQWQQGLRPPWIARVAGGHSPTSSGAESDTESSSTESEKVSEWWWWRCSDFIFMPGHVLLTQETSGSHHISQLNPSPLWCLHLLTLPSYLIIYFLQSCIRKSEVGSLRILPSPSKLQQRIAEIDQQKEELKIGVSVLGDCCGVIAGRKNKQWSELGQKCDKHKWRNWSWNRSISRKSSRLTWSIISFLHNWV